MSNLNQIFAVVNEAGKAVIFQFSYDDALQRRRIDRLSPRDLQILYQNDRIQVGVDHRKRPVYKSIADVWLNHLGRRQFIGGVTFNPAAQKPLNDVLNLWTGFAIKPAPGSWTLMRDHVYTVICAGNDQHFSYLMGLMARMFQLPGQQGEVAVVMKGAEGCGKGTLARALLKIMGQHGLAISNARHLVGNFNGHLRDVVMLFADEAFFADNRAHVGVLKSMITEPYLSVEPKFANLIQMPNYIHLFIASNEAWVVPTALESRRFFVLDVPDSKVGNHAYFAAISKEMDGGGAAAMLHDLLALDLSNFNVRAVPATEGLQQQRKLSLPVPEAWWQDCLARGYVFQSKLGLERYFGKWLEQISTELLFSSYLEFARTRRELHPLTRETLGRLLIRWGCRSMRLSRANVGEHLIEDSSLRSLARVARPVVSVRPSGYSVGKLDLARNAFEKATGLDVDWG